MVRFVVALIAASLLAAVNPSLAESPPTEAHAKAMVMDMITLSPSGQRYAFIAGNGAERKIYIATTDNKPLLAVPVGGANIRDLRWAGDNYVLLYTITTVGLDADWVQSKADFGKGIIINVDEKKISSTFHDIKTVEDSAYGFYGAAQVNGRWYGYYGGRTREPIHDNEGSYRYSNTSKIGDYVYINADLYRVDLETGDFKIVATGDLDSSDWLVDSKGEIVARLIYNFSHGDWRVKSGKFGGRDLASGLSTHGRVKIMGLGKGADSILIRYQNDNGPVVKEEVPLDGGAAKPLSDTPSFGEPIQDRQTHQWIGSITDGDDPTYTLFSPAFDARVRAAGKAFPGYHVRLMDWSADFNRMIVLTRGADDPGTYWMVDIAKQSADPLGAAAPLVGVATPRTASVCSTGVPAVRSRGAVSTQVQPAGAPPCSTDDKAP